MAERGKVIVINHVTLDGVMQGPGRADEDTRDGFTQGGWAQQHSDEEVLAAVFQRVSEAGGLQLLLGRRSYEEMLGYWNTQDSAFKDGLNNAQKYVVSSTLSEPLPWPNSTLMSGDPAGTVAQLKRDVSGELTILGSGALIQTLMRNDLIDEFFLVVHPLVLGSGRRLFPDSGTPARLQLTHSKATNAGALIAVYRLVGASDA
jgi:dihydrofolate reductase